MENTIMLRMGLFRPVGHKHVDPQRLREAVEVWREQQLYHNQQDQRVVYREIKNEIVKQKLHQRCKNRNPIGDI